MLYCKQVKLFTNKMKKETVILKVVRIIIILVVIASGFSIWMYVFTGNSLFSKHPIATPSIGIAIGLAFSLRRAIKENYEDFKKIFLIFRPGEE